MKRLYLFLLASLVFGWEVFASVPAYTNPILPYDYSDPDVCRVGDTYLMTSSSFNNVPGLQILASKDLVHWQIVDAAIRYRLPGYEEGDPVAGNFVWAPAIRELSPTRDPWLTFPGQGGSLFRDGGGSIQIVAKHVGVPEVVQGDPLAGGAHQVERPGEGRELLPQAAGQVPPALGGLDDVAASGLGLAG